jgi:hypothetical protein
MLRVRSVSVRARSVSLIVSLRQRAADRAILATTSTIIVALLVHWRSSADGPFSANAVGSWPPGEDRRSGRMPVQSMRAIRVFKAGDRSINTTSRNRCKRSNREKFPRRSRAAARRQRGEATDFPHPSRKSRVKYCPNWRSVGLLRPSTPTNIRDYWSGGKPFDEPQVDSSRGVLDAWN